MLSILLPIIYISFISLGLPDSLVGSAWPVMHVEFGVSLASAGILTAIISVGTITSSLLAERLTKKFGTGTLTAVSTLITALALVGFSFSHSFAALCLWGIPYGLGAGGVDAALNNFVAVNYKSHHMSWLHCMWGVGATIGPYIMGYALSGGTWNNGFLYIGIIQSVLVVILIASLPLWKKQRRQSDTKDALGEPDNENKNKSSDKPLTIKQTLSIPGARYILMAFFCYCAVEQTTGLWASSYLNLHLGISAGRAAYFASLFFMGITIGRALNGFLTFKFSDTQLIRLGSALIALGAAALLLPLPEIVSLCSIIVIGLGCAPIYPCIIHSTPEHFGAENSQALIGLQMAFAYVGSCVMPPIFGLIANHISISLYPVYILILLVTLIMTHELMLKKARIKD